MPGTPAATEEPPPLTDEELMSALAGGESHAFAELFARYKQPIFGFFRRRLSEPDHAEDLTQDTFVALFRSASRYEQRALFRTYLYAIALKLLRAHRRKAAFRSTFFMDASASREPSATGNVEIETLLRDALAKLDRNDREILMLREFEQLGYVEIAELLHLPVNTVRSRLFRSRSALRDVLTAPYPTPIAQLNQLEDRA
jgi:RNA polymerase sigma-70 factor (ECF subfamily)